MSIICLAGDAGAGKDTMADILVKNHGYLRIALADPLRELCSKVFRMDYKMFSDHDKKDEEISSGKVMLDYHHIDKIRDYVETQWGYEVGHAAREGMEDYYGTEFETPRDILRCVGTRLLRNHVNSDLWIELALAKIRQAGGKVVITDARFENERDTFRRFGALLVLIKRDAEMESHEHDLGSEDEYDVIFDNSGTLEEFRSNVNMWYTLRRNELEFYKVFKYE